MHITRDDILKLAKMARVAVTDDEIDGMIKQLQDVLGYAQCVCQVAADVEQQSQPTSNVLREDHVQKFPSDLVLAQAPQQEDNLFVVPHILQKTSDES